MIDRQMVNPSTKKVVRSLLFLFWVLLPILLAPQLFAQNTWVENSFEDFRDGSFLDAGSNLYVSAKGRIQIINRWDFNNDGNLDILLTSGHGHTEKENTYIYLNSQGQVDGRQRIELPGGGSRDGLVADFNKDGFNDLAIANAADSHFSRVNAWIWYGSAEGFSPSNRIELPAYHGKAIVAGDFNNDSWVDLAIACQWQAGSIIAPEGPMMSFIYWNSKEGFHPENRMPLVFEGKGANAFATADLDNDQTDDLVALAAGKTYLLLSGQDAYGDTTQWETFPVNGNALSLGDINNDSSFDLAICSKQSVIIIQSKSGKFDYKNAYRLSISQPTDVALSDLNLDGYDDVIVANAATPGGATWTDSYIFYSEKGLISEKNRVGLPTFAASGITSCDLNKDGYPDIVVGNQRITNQQNLCSYIYWNDKGVFYHGNHTQLLTMGTLATTTGDVNNDSR